METPLEMCLRIFNERAKFYYEDYQEYCKCGDDESANRAFIKVEVYDECYKILSVALRGDIEILKQYDYTKD
ncbi:MAG: hypothetical protein J6T10_32010 [Methanobrevibacter sp.]|nr:hypothetical protein [Methanobrevibacter sp.]